MRTTKLMQGKIPANTICPFRSECRDAETTCNHKGEQHSIPYSCGTARAFDIFQSVSVKDNTNNQQFAEV